MAYLDLWEEKKKKKKLQNNAGKFLTAHSVSHWRSTGNQQ